MVVLETRGLPDIKPNEDGKKLYKRICKHCKGEIKMIKNKCPHCGRFQDEV